MTILRNLSHLNRTYDATGVLISKRCITCEQQKPIGEFGQKTGAADGTLRYHSVDEFPDIDAPRRVRGLL